MILLTDWAIQNGKVEVVGALLERLENLDVLVKNSFGKSALSEAFNCGNQDILRMILEHSSASEEALLPPDDVEEVELDGEGGESGDKEDGLVHRFALDPAREGRILSIRELVRQILRSFTCHFSWVLPPFLFVGGR